MSPTIKDVAKLANTSKSTVSRYLNGLPVKKETEEALKKAIKELNYHRNENARRLVVSKTQTIGIVVDSMTNLFYPMIFRGIEEIASEKGFNCVFYSMASNKYNESYFQNLYFEGHVDGILMISFRKRNQQDLLEIADADFPVVVFGDSADVENLVSVDVDNYFGISELVRYLSRIGHRKIAYISGPSAAAATQCRLAGYLETMSQLGLEVNPEWIIPTNWSNEDGYHAMNRLLAIGDFTAVVASNDETAIGALRAVQERGFNVPSDLSITGFDDITLSSWTYPTLTTVKQPFFEMGKKAASELFKRMDEGEEYTPMRHLLKPELIIRDSCRKISEPIST
ncbi:LacI family DNA-binding transcriptional regulator [Neobacillus bataviensis]|uniref:LacI family DNA-binding transcriptional regulator n=1 Tax=Neobacillus bataviensis TaxID=220685 RepID=UPI001CBD0811|nr:LacI family DNA-binding transcriptional regulator [Neobacillus bataviensis]